jgi:hypothetical protein
VVRKFAFAADSAFFSSAVLVLPLGNETGGYRP